MPKEIIYNEDAIFKLQTGVEKLARVVKATFGPTGRTVFLHQNGKPITTKDGVTAARNVELDDPFENEGAQLAKEACLRTEKEAGDGTTTSLILTEALLKEGIRFITAGIEPRELCEGLDIASRKVQKQLIRMSDPLKQENIEKIATVAANGDKILGKLIGDLYQDGENYSIQIERHEGAEDDVERIEGLKVPSGVMSRSFLDNQPNSEVKFSEPFVLVAADEVNSLHHLLPILNHVADLRKPLAIFTPGMSNEVLSTLLTNYQSNALPVVVIKAPGHADQQREWLEDIALVSGTEIISNEKGDDLSSFTMNKLGTVESITATSNETTLKGLGQNEERDATVRMLESELKLTNDPLLKKQLEQRIGRLKGLLLILHIGAPSETALNEKFYRAEDALNAVKAALEEGVVEGGGLSFLQCIPVLKSLRVMNEDGAAIGRGFETVEYALKAVIIQLLKNAGEEPEYWLEKILDSGATVGYNTRTRSLSNMRHDGIIDPVKTLRLAVQNSVSVSRMILMTRCAIAEQEDHKIENKISEK